MIPSIPSPTWHIHSDLHLLLPRITPSPTDCPNEVVVELTTTLLIPDYSRYYDTPIRQFQPSYTTLLDGSLVTKPFMDDLTNANINLLVTGILTMLFARNLFVSGDYIRRAKVKSKGLFYLLFASQLAASVSLIPIVVSSFVPSTNCTLVNVISCASAGVSLGILILGIFGFKAYKCLNNSPFVMIALVLFFLGSSAVVALDCIYIRAERRLTGSCIRTSGLNFIRIYIFIQLAETFFICCCFLYAVWKSRGSPVARTRISLQLSMDDLALVNHDTDTEKPDTRRGWWDYVPKKEASSPVQANPESVNGRGISFLSKVKNWFSSREASDARLLRKPSVTGEFPIPQPPRPSTVHVTEPEQERRSSDRRFMAPGRTSPAPTSFSRISRLFPRMERFRDVLKDELWHTTFIAASCVAVAILTILGVQFKNGLAVTGWIVLNCAGAIISVLAISSFGRVVRRHDRDAILQEPGAWQTPGRARHQHNPSRGTSQRRWSPPAPSNSQRRFRRVGGTDLDDPGNPYSETRKLNVHSGSSWYSASSYGGSPTSPRGSFDSDKFLREHLSTMPPLPALLVDGYPTSPSNTMRESSDGTLIQGYRQSFISSSNSPGLPTRAEDKKTDHVQ